MSPAGWYVDPSGQPGRYRFWDGSQWSTETTANPADPPPGTRPGPRPGGRRGLLIAAVALVLVLAVVAFFALRSRPGTDLTEPLPTSSVSGGDDRSPPPTPTPTPPVTPTPTPSPTPRTPTAAPNQPCPVGDPTARLNYPSDGRQHGGGLSFPSQPGWRSLEQPRLSWAYDVGSQVETVEPGWFAMFAAAALSTADGFETPQRAAELAMQCTASSDLYQEFSGRRDLESEAVTVDGHPGWRLRSEIMVDNDNISVPGDVVQIIVVDLDSPESLSMFWGAVPIGDDTRIAQLDQATRDLRVG